MEWPNGHHHTRFKFCASARGHPCPSGGVLSPRGRAIGLACRRIAHRVSKNQRRRPSNIQGPRGQSSGFLQCPGADLSAPECAGKSGGPKAFCNGLSLFLLCGGLYPRKNVRTLVEAFVDFRNRLPEAPHRLVLAGSTLHRDQALRRALEAAGDYVVTLGHVPGEDLQALYGGAEAFCFPSLFEGFGIPLVEAMASGCPVLSSSTSCMPEIVADAGLLLDPMDVNAWSHALIQMAQNPEMLANYRENGLARARDFGWEPSAEIVWKSLQPC